MPAIGPMDIYRLLPRTNCGECRLPTCMALALSVIAGERRVSDCPYLEQEETERLGPIVDKRISEEGFMSSLNELRARFRGMDLSSLGPRLGASFEGGKLIIPCLTRDFALDRNGRLDSICHVNTWMETLLLSYCQARGDGRLSGRWAAFPELEGAATAGPYFQRRCTDPLLALADAHGDIFFDLLRLFGAEDASGFAADQALLLRPLPLVPLVILYSAEEEGMESALRVVFDSTATEYLAPEVLTFMGRGMAEMFRSIISKHEGCLPDILSL